VKEQQQGDARHCQEGHTCECGFVVLVHV
jgi:hypothetical protein